jgi:hypothetical protein
MEGPYLEFFHVSREELENSKEKDNVYGRYSRRALKELEQLEQEYGVIAVYEYGIDPSLPAIDLSRKVILGGGWGEESVRKRFEKYQKAGFVNVEVNPKLTIYMREVESEERLYRYKIEQNGYIFG